MFPGKMTKSMIFHQFESAPFPELLLIGSMGLVAYFMAIKSYQLIHPTIGSILKSNEVIFAFILQSTAMELIPSGFTILGAFFVILSGVLVPLETKIVQCIQIVHQESFWASIRSHTYLKITWYKCKIVNICVLKGTFSMRDMREILNIVILFTLSNIYLQLHPYVKGIHYTYQGCRAYPTKMCI